MRGVKIYTRKGDDGSTGLLHGGRVPKSSVWPAAYGTVDEAQAVIGVARAAAAGGSPDLDEILAALRRFTSDAMGADRIMRLQRDELGGQSIAEALDRPRMQAVAWAILESLG